MNANTTTQGTSAGSYGVALAITSILIWLLAMAKVDVPAEVGVAFSTVIGALLHYAVIRWKPVSDIINVPVDGPSTSTVVPTQTVVDPVAAAAPKPVAPQPIPPVRVNVSPIAAPPSPVPPIPPGGAS